MINAHGMLVRPGGIEPDAHIAQRINVEWGGGGRRDLSTQAPDFASLAGVFGGVTTIVDFATARRDHPDASIVEDVEERAKTFAGHSHADVAFHYILLGKVPQERIDQIGEAVEAGIAGFKVFTTYNRPLVHNNLSEELSGRWSESPATRAQPSTWCT